MTVVLAAGLTSLLVLTHCAGFPVYQVEREGVLSFTIRAAKADYAPGQKVVITLLLKNLGPEPLDICLTCLLEAVSVRPEQQNPNKVCGFFGDHAPGFTAERATLAPGETREEQVDVSGFACAFEEFGAGRYVVRASYCHERTGSRHGDSPEYCVQAKSLMLDYGAR